MVEECNLDMFPLVRKTCVTEMLPSVIEHLTCLENRIEEYFPPILLGHTNFVGF